jgi:hypothetical protein
MRKCRFGKKKGTNRCRKRPLTGAALRSMRGVGRSSATSLGRARRRRCKFGRSKVTGRCLKRARR